MPALFLSEDDVRELMDMETSIEVVEDAATCRAATGQGTRHVHELSSTLHKLVHIQRLQRFAPCCESGTECRRALEAES